MIISLPKLYVALLSFALMLCSASAQSIKVGIVDMNRVFAEYYKTKDADKVVNEQKEAAKKELDSINNDYKKLLDSYQKLAKEIKDPAIGEALRKKKTEEAQQVASKARALEREKKEISKDAGYISICTSQRIIFSISFFSLISSIVCIIVAKTISKCDFFSF